MIKEDKMDEFSKYVMNEAGMKSPSKSFVSGVMAQIEKEEQFVATPASLISNKMWWIIGLVATALSIYFVLNWQDHILSKYSANFQDYLLNLDSIYNGFQNIHFSDTFVWCFLLFGVLLFFQAVLIKNYTNKKVDSL